MFSPLNSPIKPLVYALSMVFLPLSVASANGATPLCTATLTEISTNSTSTYAPQADGDCLVVKPSGSITVNPGDNGVFNPKFAMGRIDNQGVIGFSGTGNGGSGIVLRNLGSVGTLDNSGVISGITGGTGDRGIELSKSSITTFTNSGNISNFYTGVFLESQSSISQFHNTTTGQIQGLDAGVYVFSNSNINTLINDGKISQLSGAAGNDVAGISLYTGTISNLTNSSSGSIEGYQGISVYSGSIVNTVVNQGTIAGTLSGVALPYQGHIDSLTNSGKISAVTGNALDLWQSTITALENSGTISGGDLGIYIGGTNSTGSSIGTLTNSGTIRGVNGAIVIDQASSATINNTGLIDGAVELGASSTLNLNGPSGRVTRAVTGNGNSTVNINGTFTSENSFDVPTFNINPGGVFNMNHNVRAAGGSGTGFNNQGTLAVAAGNTVTITGNYNQSAAGLYQTGVTSLSYGKLIVDGNANLNGKIAANVTAADTLVNGRVLSDILKATGTLTTDPLSVADNSALWDFTAQLNANNGIDLTAQQVRTATQSVQDSGSPAALGAAGAIDAIQQSGNASGDMAFVINTINALPSEAQVASVINQLVPVISGGAAQANLNQASGGGSRVVRNYISVSSANLANAGTGLAAGDWQFNDRMAWVKPFGSYSKQQDQDRIDGYKARSYGIAGGIDAQISHDWRVGGALSYGQGTVNGNASTPNNQLRIDTYQATLYGSRSLDKNTYLNLMGALGSDRNNSRRVIQFSGVDRIASADFNGWHAYLNSEIGRKLPVNAQTTIIPNLSVEYTHAQVDGYSENGADSLNLKVDSQKADSLILAIGSKLVYAPREDLRVTGHVGLGYDTMAEQATLNSSFSGGGPVFTTNGLKPSRTLLRAGFGVQMLKKNGLEVSANYDVDAREHYADQTASVNFRFPF